MLSAQTPSTPFVCGNEIFQEMVREKYPLLQEGFQQTFENALHTPAPRNQVPFTVNVVVHVIWKEEAENLHDSIIHNQLEILNNDFNRLNADTANLREIFKASAGSADIRFELIEIVRVQTSTEFDVDILSGNLLPEVKHSADGGSDGWDPQHYLNIWICKIQPIEIFGFEVGQILGFAFPPMDLPNWPPDMSAPTPEEDGVVIDFRVFGSNNPNPIETPEGGLLTVKGRTPVHEIGHYLGLRHIWGDGGTIGPNDCAQSDGIDDTPFADTQSAFDCDISKNTCEVHEAHYNADMPDLIENYMDYAREDCMNMFTHGQVNLMRNVLMGPRVGLLSPPSSVNDLEHPALTIYPNPTSGSVTLRIEGIDDPTGEVCIRDLRGIPVMYQHLVLSARNATFIETAKLNPGIYLVEFSTSNAILTKKLFVR